MKVVFSIPDDVYDTKEVQHILNETSEELGKIDPNITVRDFTDYQTLTE